MHHWLRGRPATGPPLPFLRRLPQQFHSKPLRSYSTSPALDLSFRFSPVHFLPLSQHPTSLRFLRFLLFPRLLFSFYLLPFHLFHLQVLIYSSSFSSHLLSISVIR